ncbi:MAG TPA: AMP-binding protein [Methylocella sp.]|nr:AMP-binding protein [Methylocella sp.]
MSGEAGGSNRFLDPLFTRWRKNPSALFGVVHEAGEWTEIPFGSLMNRAAQFAAVLQLAGIVQGDIVPIVLRHGLDAYAAFIGAMFAGAAPAYLPYPNVKHDHQLYWRQHRLLFEHLRPRAILVYDELADDMHTCMADLDLRIIKQSAADTALPSPNFTLMSDSATALLQHSSGTTGLKKGVALSYGSIVRQLEAYVAALRLEFAAKITIASWLPLYHDMGLISSFCLPLWRGIPVVSIDPFEWVARPALLLEGIERYRATHAWLPNFAFLHLARMVPQSRHFDLSSLEALINCSEPCKPSAFDTFLKRFSKNGIRPETLQTCYAMAETVFAVSQSEPGRAPRRLEVDRSCLMSLGAVRSPESAETSVVLLSNGLPLSNCSVRVIRDDQFMGEREIGELAVNANYIFEGYFKNQEATRRAFYGRWYRTGDVGFIDGGEVFIIGRIKELIIVNGKNIFAHDIEAALLGTPGLKPGRNVAFGYFSETAGSELLVVVAERDENEKRATTEILSDVNRRVYEAVGVPCSDIRLVPQGWLIKTTSGKVSRSENALKYAANFRSPHGVRSMSTP